MNTKKYDKSRTMCQYGILNGTGKPVIMDTERRQFKWFLVPENVYAALIPAPVRLKPCVLLALSPAPYALRRSHGASSIQYRVIEYRTSSITTLTIQTITTIKTILTF